METPNFNNFCVHDDFVHYWRALSLAIPAQMDIVTESYRYVLELSRFGVVLLLSHPLEQGAAISHKYSASFPVLPVSDTVNIPDTHCKNFFPGEM